MERILEVKNLAVRFGSQPIIDDLNFEVEKGETLAVIGPNGSGKTVLLRALLGSVPYSGKVVWEKDTTIGYVPQKIEADKHLPITAENLLKSKAHILDIEDPNISRLAEEVGLDQKQFRLPIGHLSGGNFQRALIAFALLGDPKVLLLDEPTASIDQQGGEKIYDLAHRLQNKHDLTIILVSHDISFITRYASKVLCLNKTNVCFGEPEETLNKETLERLYGGPHKHFHHHHEDGNKFKG